jgi:hypothetical protein
LRVGDVIDRLVEIWVIERVIRLGSEGEVHTFGKSNAFCERDIHIEEVRTIDVVTSRSSKPCRRAASGRARSELRGTEAWRIHGICTGASNTRQRRCEDSAVDAVVVPLQRTERCPIDYCKGQSGTVEPIGRQRPASEDPVWTPTEPSVAQHIGEQQGRAEIVPNVVIRVTTDIEGVLRCRDTFVRSQDAEGLIDDAAIRNVIQRMAPRVVQIEGNSGR